MASAVNDAPILKPALVDPLLDSEVPRFCSRRVRFVTPLVLLDWTLFVIVESILKTLTPAEPSPGINGKAVFRFVPEARLWVFKVSFPSPSFSDFP